MNLKIHSNIMDLIMKNPNDKRLNKKGTSSYKSITRYLSALDTLIKQHGPNNMVPRPRPARVRVRVCIPASVFRVRWSASGTWYLRPVVWWSGGLVPTGLVQDRPGSGGSGVRFRPVRFGLVVGLHRLLRPAVLVSVCTCNPV